MQQDDGVSGGSELTEDQKKNYNNKRKRVSKQK